MKVIKVIILFPMYVSHFFQSFLGTILGAIAGMVFCGTVIPFIIIHLTKFMSLVPSINNFIYTSQKMYSLYMGILILITILPFFSYRSKLRRSGR